MCEAEKGLVGLIYKTWETVRCLNSVVFTVFSTAGTLQNIFEPIVIKLIVSLGNFICSHGLKCHQLRELSSEIEAEYLGLTYPTAVLCLSSGKVLLYYFELRAQIEIFPNEKNHLQPL